MPQTPLRDLLVRAENKILVIPEFQRDFVWKPSDILKLLSSLFNSYPIGGLLFMENSESYAYQCLDGIDETKPEEINTDAILVLDGQQRLTSCFKAFYSAMSSQKNPGKYYFDFKSFSNLTASERSQIEGSKIDEYLKFVPKKEVEKSYRTTAEEISAGLFPLDIIFRSPRGVSYSKWLTDYIFNYFGSDKALYEKLADAQSDFINRFIERITGYHVHYEEIQKDASKEVICTVFETINTTGKKLTVFDLLVARCYPHGLRLRDELLSAVQENVYINHFDPTGEEICPIILPKIIALLSRSQCKRAELLTLPPAIIKEHWQPAVQSLETCLQYLSNNFGAISNRFLPIKDILPAMSVILGNPKWKNSKIHQTKLKKWYWRSVFSGYFSSAPDSNTVKTVKEWIEDGGWFDNDENEPGVVRNFNYFTDILDGVARSDNAIYLGVFSSLLANSLQDFGTDRQPLGSNNQKSWDLIEDHHIFPKGLLSPHGIKGDDVNQVANRTPILRATNQAIKNLAPNTYFNDSSIVGTPIGREILEGHLIPEEIASTQFSIEVFKDFIQKRKIALIDRITNLVEQDPIVSAD